MSKDREKKRIQVRLAVPSKEADPDWQDGVAGDSFLTICRTHGSLKHGSCSGRPMLRPEFELLDLSACS